MPRRSAPARGGRKLDDALVRTAEFRSVLRRFLNSTTVAASSADLTPQRYDLLLMIKAGSVGNEPVTIGSLCRRLDLRQPAVTELVQRVEQVGLVSRSRSPADGRVFHLELTPEGEDRLMRVFGALGEDRSALAETFARLGETFHAATPAPIPPRRSRRPSASRADPSA